MVKIQKECTICGQTFFPKTVDSIYCSRKCSGAAYRKKKALQKMEEQQKAIADKISDERLYISVQEAVALFGVAKSTLYRLIRQRRIPAINLGTYRPCCNRRDVSYSSAYCCHERKASKKTIQP